jgi:hypothetical protein
MAKFNRWKCPWNRTWAFLIFKEHHTQLNEFWWAQKCAYGKSMSLAKSVGLDNKASQAFPDASFHVGRSNNTLRQWNNYYYSFGNWAKLSFAMGLCAYFEVYLATVVRIALSSDPAIKLKVSHAVDGVALLRNGQLPPVKPELELITKGTWHSRLAAYQKLFGSAPAVLINGASELDHLRILRNGVGHAFGRDIDAYESESCFKAKELTRLSDARLQKWLGVVEKSAVAIDAHLRDKHVGPFELFEFYHLWDKRYNKGSCSEAVAFKSMIPMRTGDATHANYFKELIDHYNSC